MKDPKLFGNIADIPDGDWRWRFFSPSEVRCKGSGQLLVVPTFLDKMDLLRELFGKSLSVNSWYRSPEHNDKVASTGLTGPHTTGRAVDLAVRGADAYYIVQLALQLGFTGIGAASTFIHLDDLKEPDYPRPRIWSY